MHLGDDAEILAALNPIHALECLARHKLGLFCLLGSVFLIVTGGEAFYADMGHFGRRPIRIAWAILVFPALAISYLRQGLFVLNHLEAVTNPFFLMAPQRQVLPLVILTTAVTVIASQAVISYAFFMMQQMVQMGLLPWLKIRHTTETQHRQINMPDVNLILMVAVIRLVLAFGS